MDVDQIQHLEQERTVLIAYLGCKADSNDWHAVATAANDLRVIEAKLEILHRTAACSMPPRQIC